MASNIPTLLPTSLSGSDPALTSSTISTPDDSSSSTSSPTSTTAGTETTSTSSSVSSALPPDSSSTTSEPTSSAVTTSASFTSFSGTTASSSTTSSSDTSTSTTPVPVTTSTAATSTSQTVIRSTNSAGQVATITSVVVVAPTPTFSDQASIQKSSSKGFFQNTGAVAGVFTVVGLVVVVLIVAVVTNAIRRRRAQKLDREIAEAAVEAPAFNDDDYFGGDNYGGKGNNGSGGDMRSMTTGYSDTTHGTFAQPPMALADLPSSTYDYGAAAAGAAGVGAMGLNRARSMGQNQTQPYNAFAAPQSTMPSPYEGYPQQRSQDLLDAAGLATGGAAAGYAAAHMHQNGNGTNLARNPSLGPSQATSTSASDYSSYPYSHDYNAYGPAQGATYNQFQQSPPQGYPPHVQHGVAVQQSPDEHAPRPTSIVDVDPYGGYVEPNSNMGHANQAPPVKAPSPQPERLLGGNFASPPASSEDHGYPDDGDDDERPRVLRVANE